jgi:hypothetical protein
MTQQNDEEYEGVTLYVEASDWPSNLDGLFIDKQVVYRKDGKVKIVGDPIWRISPIELDENE